jgi:two-component system sensor histidine kinase/response regulator
VGVEVLIAANGQIAVEMARQAVGQGYWDAILMDMQMPVLDGLGATRALHALPGWDGTPIVAMTANAMPLDRQRCLDAGMVDFISKPIDPEQLFGTLRRWINKAPGSGRNADATVAPHAEAEASSDLWDGEALLEIPGIDTRKGLYSVLGRMDRYVLMLQTFAQDQGRCGTRIVTALEQGDSALAERLAHTLHGVAGQVGAGALSTLAADLESALRERPPMPYSQALWDMAAQLQRSLETHVQAIQHALPLGSAAAPGPQAAALRDASVEAEILGRLADLLEQDDPRALALLKKHEATLAMALPQHFEAIKTAVTAFELDAAARILNTARAVETSTGGVT